MRKVIYTCLTGGYDVLKQPAVTDSSFDYVCFTDDASRGHDGIWELRPIPFEADAVTRARYAKLHPHTLLPEYEVSVFMDANLCISGEEFYAQVEYAISAGHLVAGLPHPQRDCVWDELRYCYLKDKLTTAQAFRHHRFLGRISMPRHAGLYETNVLLRFHNEPTVVALDTKWWELFSACCSRDQLTFTPALLLQGFKMPPHLFSKARCARNVPFVQYTLHPGTGSGAKNTPGRLTWGNIRYRLRLSWRQLCLLLLR